MNSIGLPHGLHDLPTLTARAKGLVHALPTPELLWAAACTPPTDRDKRGSRNHGFLTSNEENGPITSSASSHQTQRYDTQEVNSGMASVCLPHDFTGGLPLLREPCLLSRSLPRDWNPAASAFRSLFQRFSGASPRRGHRQRGYFLKSHIRPVGDQTPRAVADLKSDRPCGSHETLGGWFCSTHVYLWVGPPHTCRQTSLPECDGSKSQTRPASHAANYQHAGASGPTTSCVRAVKCQPSVLLGEQETLCLKGCPKLHRGRIQLSIYL